MKKLVLLLVFVFIIVGLFIFLKKSNTTNKKNELVSSVQKKELQQAVPIVSPSLFVPYWTLTNDLKNSAYPNLLYFGLAVNRNGIDTDDLGYKNVPLFIQAKPEKSTSSLVIRMTDSKTNFAILEKKDIQKKIIDESISVARKNGFNGIVLDLEVSSLPFDSIVSSINDFVSEFSKESHKRNLSFSITLFGDTFSKIRPYDVSYLEKQSDAIYVMAYDFHKANRAAGPNFPFVGKQTYGYDFKTMVSDFSHLIPKEKLVIVFGMFGYDWTVNENGETIRPAKALSFFEIKKLFFPSCSFSSCILVENPTSYEIKITYKDQEGQNHVVWFENENSVKKKIEFLNQQGISSIGYWAYSFF